MVDAVRYQDIVRSGENANCESGYLEPISCTDEGEYTEYTELDTLPDSSPVSSTDHAVNASKSEEKPVYHTIGKPDRKRIAITTKENGNKRPKQILDSSATKKLKVLCIVSLAIIIVITVATVALVYILVILIYSIHLIFFYGVTY